MAVRSQKIPIDVRFIQIPTIDVLTADVFPKAMSVMVLITVEVEAMNHYNENYNDALQKVRFLMNAMSAQTIRISSLIETCDPFVGMVI